MAQKSKYFVHKSNPKKVLTFLRYSKNKTGIWYRIAVGISVYREGFISLKEFRECCKIVPSKGKKQAAA